MQKEQDPQSLKREISVLVFSTLISVILTTTFGAIFLVGTFSFLFGPYFGVIFILPLVLPFGLAGLGSAGLLESIRGFKPIKKNLFVFISILVIAFVLSPIIVSVYESDEQATFQIIQDDNYILIHVVAVATGIILSTFIKIKLLTKHELGLLGGLFTGLGYLAVTMTLSMGLPIVLAVPVGIFGFILGKKLGLKLVK